MWTIARTLAQDRIWITQDGRRMLISEMDQSHRQNTHAYLLRRAKEIHEHVRLQIHETLYVLRVEDLHQLKGRIAHLEIEMDPERWLLATPFMCALAKAIRDHGTEDGEVVYVTYGDVPELGDGASL